MSYLVLQTLHGCLARAQLCRCITTNNFPRLNIPSTSVLGNVYQPRGDILDVLHQRQVYI